MTEYRGICVPEKLVRIAENLHKGEMSTVYGERERERTARGESSTSPQGSTLSPFLFMMVLDVLSEYIRRQNHWELLLSGDNSRNRRRTTENIRNLT